MSKVRLASIVVCASLVASVALAEPDFDTAPDWLRKPTPEMLKVLWPKEAFAQGVRGSAVIACKVSAAGALYACEVDSESPADWGFGDAAIALAPQLLMKPAMKDGAPVAGVSVGIPVVFAWPGDMSQSFLPKSSVKPLNDPSLMQKHVSQAPWVEAPSAADVAAAYPRAALAAGRPGHATLSCGFTAKGRLRGCHALNEEPRGEGFAAAARSLTPGFLAMAQLADGTPIRKATTEISFTFAPVPSGAAVVIEDPRWLVAPSAAEMARASGGGDRPVQLICMVDPGGTLSACEDPDHGRTRAAPSGDLLALTSIYKIGLWTTEGLPTIGSRVRLAIGDKAEARPVRVP